MFCLRQCFLLLLYAWISTSRSSLVLKVNPWTNELASRTLSKLESSLDDIGSSKDEPTTIDRKIHKVPGSIFDEFQKVFDKAPLFPSKDEEEDIRYLSTAFYEKSVKIILLKNAKDPNHVAVTKIPLSADHMTAQQKEQEVRFEHPKFFAQLQKWTMDYMKSRDFKSAKENGFTWQPLEASSNPPKSHYVHKFSCAPAECSKDGVYAEVQIQFVDKLFQPDSTREYSMLGGAELVQADQDQEQKQAEQTIDQQALSLSNIESRPLLDFSLFLSGDNLVALSPTPKVESVIDTTIAIEKESKGCLEQAIDDLQKEQITVINDNPVISVEEFDEDINMTGIIGERLVEHEVIEDGDNFYEMFNDDETVLDEKRVSSVEFDAAVNLNEQSNVVPSVQVPFMEEFIKAIMERDMTVLNDKGFVISESNTCNIPSDNDVNDPILESASLHLKPSTGDIFDGQSILPVAVQDITTSLELDSANFTNVQDTFNTLTVSDPIVFLESDSMEPLPTNFMLVETVGDSISSFEPKEEVENKSGLSNDQEAVVLTESGTVTVSNFHDMNASISQDALPLQAQSSLVLSLPPSESLGTEHEDEISKSATQSIEISIEQTNLSITQIISNADSKILSDSEVLENEDRMITMTPSLDTLDILEDQEIKSNPPSSSVILLLQDSPSKSSHRSSIQKRFTKRIATIRPTLLRRNRLLSTRQPSKYRKTVFLRKASSAVLETCPQLLIAPKSDPLATSNFYKMIEQPAVTISVTDTLCSTKTSSKTGSSEPEFYEETVITTGRAQKYPLVDLGYEQKPNENLSTPSLAQREQKDLVRMGEMRARVSHGKMQRLTRKPFEQLVLNSSSDLVLSQFRRLSAPLQAPSDVDSSREPDMQSDQEFIDETPDHYWMRQPTVSAMPFYKSCSDVACNYFPQSDDDNDNDWDEPNDMDEQTWQEKVKKAEKEIELEYLIAHSVSAGVIFNLGILTCMLH